MLLNSPHYLIMTKLLSLSLSSPFSLPPTDLADVSISFRPFECTEGDENPYIGSTVIIDCSAEGEPFPRVAWFFQDNILRDSDVPNIHFQQNNRVLVITSLQSNNTGHYYCQSENGLFSAKRSSDIVLGIQGWICINFVTFAFCCMRIIIIPPPLNMWKFVLISYEELVSYMCRYQL